MCIVYLVHIYHPSPRSTLSQYGTPPYCLLHALDVVPCDYRNPTTTDKPEAK